MCKKRRNEAGAAQKARTKKRGKMEVLEPLVQVDACTGKRMRVVMKNNREFVGTMRGFDDFVSLLAHPYEDKRRQAKHIAAHTRKWVD